MKNGYIEFENVYLGGFASSGGKKESEGPLGRELDIVYDDDLHGEQSFEKAEIKMQKDTLSALIAKCGIREEDIDVIIAGDLLNQCTASSFAARGRNISYLGQYAACATFLQSIILSGIAVCSGRIKNAAAMASSHFAAAERQYRFPLEYGSQMTDTAQRTVTGCGAVLITGKESGIRLKSALCGRIEDMGITDMSDMGAAMAPAAAKSITAYFKESGRKAEDYDIILSGDLAERGGEILKELMKREGTPLYDNYADCGTIIYDIGAQKVGVGGSGAGCSASVICSRIFGNMEKGIIKNALLCGTGALLSPTTSLQGESIPAICHIAEFERS